MARRRGVCTARGHPSELAGASALVDDDVLVVEPNATHLLFDDHYTSERDGLEFVMHQPRRTDERSVTPELPWETHIAGYNSGELG